jgi:hypothetical protein
MPSSSATVAGAYTLCLVAKAITAAKAALIRPTCSGVTGSPNPTAKAIRPLTNPRINAGSRENKLCISTPPTALVLRLFPCYHGGVKIDDLTKEQRIQLILTDSLKYIKMVGVEEIVQVLEPLAKMKPYKEEHETSQGK